MSGDGDPAAAVTTAGLWRNRDFNLLWGSQTLSNLGSSINLLATPLLVLALTHSPVQAGLVGTLRMVVGVVLSAPSGVFADRYDRRRVLLACDATRLVAVGVLAAAVLGGYVNIGLIIAVGMVTAAATAVFDTTERAALRSLVGTGQASTAVARNEARIHAVALAGPPVGGLLFGIGRALPFVADVVSYLLSLTGVLTIRRPLNQARTARTETGYGRDLIEGARFVFSHPFLRAVLLTAAPLNAAFNGAMFSLIVVLQRHGTPPAAIGAVQTIFSVGGLTGALAAPWLNRTFSLPRLIILFCWISATAMTLSSLLTTSVLAAVPLALGALLAPACGAGLFGYQAAITPDRLQGRVTGVVYTAVASASALTPLLIGSVIARFGGMAGLLTSAAAAAVAAIVATTSRAIRTPRAVAPEPCEPTASEAAPPSGDRVVPPAITQQHGAVQTPSRTSPSPGDRAAHRDAQS